MIIMGYDNMKNKNNKNNNYRFCSKSQLDRFMGKVCVWNLSFMRNPICGKLIEVTDSYFLIEMQDGRALVASIESIVGFGMTRNKAGVQ